jgi:hypothetical protein
MRMRSLMVILASGTLLGLAACGSSGSAGSRMTPAAVSLYTDALAALKSAQSVRLSGTITNKGQVIRVDMGLFRSGAVSGSLSGPFAGASSVSFHLIVTGGTAYILDDKQFFQKVLQRNGLPASACAIFCGKYFKVPAKQFSSIFSLNALINQTVRSNVKVSATVTSSTINGKPAYRLADTHGEYLYVAKSGIHYPIETTRPGSGAIVFSEWNSVPPISAPPASQIVSLPTGIG